MVSAVAAFTACNNEIIEPKGVGSLQIGVSCQTEYRQVESGNVPRSRATDDEIINELSIDITRPYDGWKINYTPFSSIRGKVVELGSGDYLLTASSRHRDDAAYDQPIYFGKKDFTIHTGQVASVDVLCRIINTKVTVALTDRFRNELSACTVTVSNGKGSLSWNRNVQTDDFKPVADADGNTIHTSIRSGYFTVSPLIVTVDGYREATGEEASAILMIDNVNAADHHIIYVDAAVTGQIGGIDIRLSSEVNPINQTVIVPGLEEIPVPGDKPSEEDPSGSGDDSGAGSQTPELSSGPQLFWTANPTFEPSVISSDLDATLVVKAEAGIKTFMVTVDSDVEDFNMAVREMISSEAGSTNQTMDMIGNEYLIQMLSFFGVNLPTGSQIEGKTEVIFPITPFLGLISSMYEPAPGDEHRFTLEVSDNNGESFVKTVTFISE